MNINYHYFVIKTLAGCAGFGEDDAQQIAQYSQMIDDFVLNSPLILEDRPPDFFIQNELAFELPFDLWLFFPHATGLGTVRTILPKFQRETALPFHFITTKTLPELETNKSPDRSEYRCVEASSENAVLVNSLATEICTRAAENHDKKTLMELGMLLHTYADTFSHCHFSGLDGWENNSYVDRAFDTYKNKDGMNKEEIFFFRSLPSIGHGNVGHTPDICGYNIRLCMRENSSGKLKPIIERSNMDFFDHCSRIILYFLCKANHKAAFSEQEWSDLQNRLHTAELVPDERDISFLEQHWKQVFPEFNYHFDKRECFSITLSERGAEADQLFATGASKAEILDIFSEKGNDVRKSCLLSACNADEDFFDYNEHVYMRVKKVTGEFGLTLTEKELDRFKNAAERLAPALQ